MGQTFRRMGTKDPRIAFDGKLDYRITQQLRAWSKLDDPPKRVRPAPVTLVLHILHMAYAHGAPSPAECAIADMACLAFFYLLRPGEYTGTTNDDAAFTLNDIHLYIGTRRLALDTSPIADLEASTSVGLYFTTQKNQRRGDCIAHGRSGHPLCCPVLCAIRRVLAHRDHFTTQQTPFNSAIFFASYYHRGRRMRVRADDITARLRRAASTCFHATGIPPNAISARSLRAGGAMALLCGGADKLALQLLGRWHSESHIQYLHQDALPIMKHLALTMFNDGSYSFLPTGETPPLADA